MKRFFVPIGLLVFFALCLVPSGNAQQGIQVSYASAPAQLALSWTFTASSPSTNAFTVNGLRYFQLFFVPAGTVSACAISLDSSTGSGFSTGGILSSATIGSCASATIYANTTATTPTLIGQLTPTITGTGTVTVILLGYVNNPAGSSGSSSNASVGATGAAIPASATAIGALNSGNLLSLTADTLGDLHVVLENSVSTQPTGFGSGLSFQQAVTATATALATNSSHSFCVVALPTNALTVWIGFSSGITTGSGSAPLPAGGTYCLQLSNTNLVYVIASGTGSSVSVIGE